LEKIVKKFELFGIQTYPIPLNPHGLRANRTSPKKAKSCYSYSFLESSLSPTAAPAAAGRHKVVEARSSRWTSSGTTPAPCTMPGAAQLS
jgi:hypothetical protein